MFMYYSNQGYDYLPKNEQTMFQRIMRLARWRGINLGQIGFFKGGTIPFFIGHLARVTWRFYGYLDGKAELHSFLQSGRRGEPEILMELDEGDHCCFPKFRLLCAIPSRYGARSLGATKAKYPRKQF